MIEIARLETFIQAAENLNFTDAARNLHLTQPTVSHHIKALEKELDQELFLRVPSGLRLTEAGRLLLPWARKIVRDSIELTGMMDALKKGVVGSLRIACSTTAGKYVLPQLAARFCQMNPGVNVCIKRCTPDHVGPNLLDDDVNLGVVSYEMHEDNIELQEFFEDSISLIVPSNHPWASRASIRPAELIGEPIIMRESTSGTRRVLTSELAKHDISLDDIHVFMELGNAEAIVRTVSAGYGVSFVSTLASACPLEGGNIVDVPIEDFELRRKVFMVRKRLDVANRTQEAFWSFVHDPANLDLILLAHCL
jgi:LysR family transcriptional regulator, low CO2-responsive transcriptional regulator